ncbi:DUF6255 family natural product biosynthesis protein [Streptomyces sp. NPDC046215]|uniref:Uncharacterized protein n=1 Tax=Streptomyces stramineus TaxID=173861 RepID=A0ABP3K1Y6_9ACTN
MSAAVLAGECRHESAWTQSKGRARCGRCGVERFTDYGSLRPVDLPHVVKPANTHWADRAAAAWISQMARRATWWGLGVGGGPFTATGRTPRST